MKKIVLASVIALGAVIGVNSALADGDASKGKVIADAKCAACHGSDGNSPSPMFPKIAGLGAKYIEKQLNDIKGDIRTVPEMTGLLNDNSEQDLADLAAYFASQPLQLAGATDADLRLNSGETVKALTLGEEIYRSGNSETSVPACSGCHSPRGLGNAPAGFPRLGGQYAAYIEKQLMAFRAGERANDGEARIMRSTAEHMSDAEIKAVAAYISGLH